MKNFNNPSVKEKLCDKIILVFCKSKCTIIWHELGVQIGIITLAMTHGASTIGRNIIKISNFEINSRNSPIDFNIVSLGNYNI